VKRIYKQSIIDDEGNVVATRELKYDEDESTYKRPVFLAHLIKQEDEFLAEMFAVETEVVE
jgi:hypothetical protein